MGIFSAADFRIFDIAGFHERMGTIMLRIRPGLTQMGEALAPALSALVDRPLTVHVAKHARRTVNPPDDTWAALGPDPRGYKKDVHFKVAVSRHCVRFLFEVGPEYYAKVDWARNWRRDATAIGGSLRKTGLAWFRNEHDEEPATALRDLDNAGLAALGDELTRKRDGQFVLGQRVESADFAGMSLQEIEKTAVTAFTPVAPLFHLHDFRK